jgi:hypothetical protein
MIQKIIYYSNKLQSHIHLGTTMQNWRFENEKHFWCIMYTNRCLERLWDYGLKYDQVDTADTKGIVLRGLPWN